MTINTSNLITLGQVITPATNRPAQARTVSTERESAITQTTGIRVDRDVIERLDHEREAQAQQQTYQQNNHEQRNERAIAAYQSLQYEQRRSEVQAMLGVDLYA